MPRGTVHLAPGARYEGGMDEEGRRCGRGTLIVHDDEAGADTYLTGLWRDDELDGPAVYTAADGCTVHGTYTRGELRGHVVELFADGTLHFAGRYVDGAREGYGIELRADGGCLEGEWRAGVAHGMRCCYHYPCADGGALVGEWRDGQMLRARYVLVPPRPAPTEPPPKRMRPAAACPAEPPLPHAALLNPSASARARAAAAGEYPSLDELPRADPRAHAYAYGPGTDDALPPWPRVRDPHEAARVACAPSAIDGAGLGLFAVRPLPPGEVVAFFAGMRVSAAEAAARKPDAVSHALELDDETGVLVPHGACAPSAEHAAAADGAARARAAAGAAVAYAASSGHWANFCFSSNAVYEPFEHPRFGLIACVRVRRAPEGESAGGGGARPGVRAGAEVTVDYPLYPEHAPDGLPAWFRAYAHSRTEDGYYFHLRMTPPRELASVRSAHALHSTVRALAHGPWRVLHLGRVEQGMTYVLGARAAEGGEAAGGAGADAGWCEPAVVGFEYVRTAAVGALGCGALWRAPAGSAVLAVGLGAGSLPLFLAHHLPSLHVSAVELDDAVTDIARRWLRNPLPFPVHSADGAAHLASLLRARSQPEWRALAAIVLDAYDARGRVPEHLCTREFLATCGALLAPAGRVHPAAPPPGGGGGTTGARAAHGAAAERGGVLVANVFNGAPGSAAWARLCAFAAALEACVGPVCCLQVHGQEMNLVLLARSHTRLPACATDADARACEEEARLAHAAATAELGGERALDPAALALLERLSRPGAARPWPALLRDAAWAPWVETALT